MWSTAEPERPTKIARGWKALHGSFIHTSPPNLPHSTGHKNRGEHTGAGAPNVAHEGGKPPRVSSLDCCYRSGLSPFLFFHAPFLCLISFVLSYIPPSLPPLCPNLFVIFLPK